MKYALLALATSSLLIVSSLSFAECDLRELNVSTNSDFQQCILSCESSPSSEESCTATEKRQACLTHCGGLTEKSGIKLGSDTPVKKYINN